MTVLLPSSAPVRTATPAYPFVSSIINPCIVIQGTSDLNGKLSQAEISKTVDFCFHAFRPVDEGEKRAVLQKLETLSLEQDDSAGNATKPKQTVEMLEANLTEDETRILNTIRGRQMLRSEDTMNIENLAADVINGRRINLERGSLGLVEPSAADKKKDTVDILALMVGEERPAEVKMESYHPEVAAH